MELGDVVFALGERANRVHVCTISRGGYVEDVGWMDRADLLEQQTRALTVGDGIQQGLEVVPFDLEGRLNSIDALPLRVVSQRVRGTMLQGRPGAGGAEDNPDRGVVSWPWHYVYDQELVDGRTWLLLGHTPSMRAGIGFEHSEVSGPHAVLRGWAPLDETRVWATNLFLELNTDGARVAHRVANDEPATVYAAAGAQAGRVWVEPLEELWGTNGEGRPEIGDMVSTDPLGLGPHFPRLAVLGREGDYLHVASAAYSGLGVSPSAVGRMRRAALSAVQTLRRVDVVFVVDATGVRMAEAMEETIGFLRRSGDFVYGVPVEATLPGGRTEVVSTASDVRVSVIGFQDMNDARRVGYNVAPKVILADLANDADDIEEAFRALILDTRGPNRGTAALHDGLREAMKSRYWREDSVNRIVVVMSDEAGDTDDLQALVDEMPVFSEEALAVAPEMRAQLEALDELHHKKMRTKLYSVFLGPEPQWRAFRENVAPVSTEMFGLFDYNDSDNDNDRGLVDAVEDLLFEQQEAVAENIRVFVSVLEQGQVGSAFDIPGGLTELAIRVAGQRAGRSPEDVALLDSVVQYEGFVPESAAILPDNGDDQNVAASHWRLRVLVSENEAYLLQRASEDVAAGLTAALSGETRKWLGDVFGEVGRKELIAGVIVRAAEQVVGLNRFSDDEQGRDAFAAAVRALVEAVRVRNDLVDTDLAGVAGLHERLPVRSDGLLGLSLGELFELPEDWFPRELRRLRNVGEGWRRIASTLSTPENPAEVQSAPRHVKYWFMETGLAGNRQERTAYVPFGYIP